MTTNEGMHVDDESKGNGVDIDKRDKLANHFMNDLNHPPQLSAYGWNDRCAHNLMLNPQAHIDALVAAGVLAPEGSHSVFYRVVQPEPPHVHEWEVNGLHEDVLAVRCGCGKSKWVPNKLPIEVPDA